MSARYSTTGTTTEPVMDWLHRTVACFVAALLAVVTVTAGTSAEAHEFHPEREILVQVFAGHVDVMVVYTEAPGERTDLFRGQFGFALDGGADEAVVELAGRSILPRVLDGLEFEVQGEHAEANDPQVHFEMVGDRLRVVSWARYDVEELPENQRRTMIVRAEDRPFLTSRLVIYGGDDVRPAGGAVPPRVDDAGRVVELHRDDEHSVSFRRR